MSFLDKLFKKELPEKTSSEFASLFQRTDLENFFSKLSYYYDPELLINKVSSREMLTRLYDSDAEIMAAVDKRIAAIQSTRLEIISESEENKKFFEEQIMPHEHQLKEDFWWAVAYGYNVEQIIYHPDRSGNVLGFQREKFWRFQPQPDLTHVMLRSSASVQNIYKTNELLPYGKWVLTTHKATAYQPQGTSLFARLYLPWLFRCSNWDFWIRFAERFAGGFLVGKTPDPKLVNDMRIALDQATKAASIAVDSQSDVSMMFPTTNGETFKLLDDQIVNIYLRAILGETQTSKVELRGSSQSAEVHDGVRFEKTLSDIRMIEKSFNETIRQIAMVNDITENIPTVKLHVEDGIDQERANRDATLKNAGIITFTPEYLKRHYGFKDDEIKEIEATFPGLGFSIRDEKNVKLEKSGCPSCGQIHFAKDETANEVQDPIEDVIKFLKEKKISPLRQEDLFAAIDSAKNENELLENLSAIYDQDSPEFGEVFTKALYYVSSLGILNANKR